MNMHQNIQQLLASLSVSLQDWTFVKLSLWNYKGSEENLEKIYVKAVLIKNEQKLSFVYRYPTKDITKNYSYDEWVSIIWNFIWKDQFCFAWLFTTQFDCDVTYTKDDTWSFKKRKATNTVTSSWEHDRQKNRKIEANWKHYLQELKITDANGKILNHAQDKYKQINHYIDILSPLLNDLPHHEILNLLFGEDS